MPTPRRDKTTGLPIPSPVVPPTSICFSIQVPNALEYRSAFKGALASLAQAWTWAQTAGSDNAASYEAAELWQQRLNEAFYSLDCGGEPMSCDDVTDCIETNPGTKAAVQALSYSTPIDGYTYPPGTPLTPGQMTARLNEIDECAFDAYWAQVEQYVDFMVDLGQDVLDQIAAYSAALDAGENVPMGQFLGKLKNSSTAGKVIDFLQWALTVVKAAYEAADNATNRNAIKCAIFCANRDACLITIQGTLDVLNDRLGGLLTPGDLEDLPSMIDAFLVAGFDPALALDLWITFLMGSAKTAGMFGLQGIDETLNLVLAVAVNDANNDWELLCEDCPPIDACIEQDFSTGATNGWADTSSPGTFSNFTSTGVSRGADATQIAIQKAIAGVVSRIEVEFDAPLDGSGGVMWAGSTGLTGLTAGSSSDQKLWVWDGLTLSGGIGIDMYRPGGYLSDQRIVRICYELA